jgi:hypothetical protein
MEKEKTQGETYLWDLELKIQFDAPVCFKQIL